MKVTQKIKNPLLFYTAMGSLFCLLISCNEPNRSDSSVPATVVQQKTNDTIIGSRDVLGEVAGSAYLKKAIAYFVIVGTDTSAFTCIFKQAHENGNVSIDLNTSSSKKYITHKKRLKELTLILPKAAKDFTFDSLTSISIGRLVENGDLAVWVTQQYDSAFASNTTQPDYKIVGRFLSRSNMGTALNIIFKPYSLSVDNVSIEKMLFTTKKELYSSCILETDSSQAPDRVLDCITWVKLKKY